MSEYAEEDMAEQAHLLELSRVKHVSGSDEIELKPCPFCGSIEIHFSDSRGGAEGYMSCWNCDARGPSENNKSSALSSWNERRNA